MKIVIPIIALSALIASGVSAWSGSPSTNNLQIKMKIDEACTVNSGGDAVLDFGEHGLVTGDIDAQTPSEDGGSIHVLCTAGIYFSIYLDAGRSPIEPGNIMERRMTNGKGDYIRYQLYLTPSRSQYFDNWGAPPLPQSGSVGWGAVNLGKGLTDQFSHSDAGAQPIPVYGRIQKSDIPFAPGIYSDTVTVTVTF